MDTITKKTTCTVTAYSGYKANERPLTFDLKGQEVRVKTILDRWVEEDHDCFKVISVGGRRYVLRWNRVFDTWSVETIRS